MTNLTPRVVEKLVEQAVTRLPNDVEKALRRATAKEKNRLAKTQLKAILENLALAAKKRVPLCQDTGTLVFFVKGKNFKGVTVAIEKGVTRATKRGMLRPNSVDALTRKPLNSNKPIVFFEYENSPVLEITVLPKGAGSENRSALLMLSPVSGPQKIKREITRFVSENARYACPPVIVGVGIGGTSDEAMHLAKKSLLQPLNAMNRDPTLRKMEKDLLKKINSLGIGVMGLGGSTTALAVRILKAPTHTASLPVAVNLQCWAGRRATTRIK